MSNHDEYKTHVAIVKHHRSAFPHVKLLYIPNAVRNAADAFFNKEMGAEAGAHDLMLFWRKAVFNLIPWIGVGIYEVKSRTGRLSAPQNKFASGMAVLGANTAYGGSVKHYHETLKSWGLKPAHESVQEPDYRTWDQKKQDAFNFYRPVEKAP